MSFAKNLKTIVVATDLEGKSEAALEYASKIAGAYGARIVLAHGIDPVHYADLRGIPSKVREDLTAQARTSLESLSADLLREGIPSHSEIRQGAVAQMLVDVARQYEAGLIVIGTQGIDGAGAVIVGAVAEQLVRMAPCPVMAVAADWNAGEFRPVPGGPVLLALEHNESASAAVEAACSLAETFERSLVVLHARRPAEAVAFLNPRATTLEELGVPAGGAFPVRTMIKDGNPADAIAEAIEQCHPCILVAGVKRASKTPGRHGTAFTLLARSRVPVLCVPPQLATALVDWEESIPVAAN
jgi:nucleotide-binding universal stress UspA family protein